MKFTIPQPAYLLLEDGSFFKGYAIGKKGTTVGEICFNTAMTGYQETFTDPSYYGQILVMTTAHIGNYGVVSDEVESDGVKISGLVVKNFTDKHYSRTRAEKSLQEYLEENNIVGISNIDTRKLVRHIRDKGAMNAVISSEYATIEELKEKVLAAPKMEGLELASKVSAKQPYTYGEEDAEIRIAVMDFGVKRNILKCLQQRGAFLKIFPYDAKPEEVLSFEPDGIMLSNGPGDPAPLKEQQILIQTFLEKEIPVFGICLGHQLLSLAAGLRTKKMHNGHRGVNHPVRNELTGKGEITSQNHGFVVDELSVENAELPVEITHYHLNDRTIAGIKLKGKPAFSVQYHPEASPGPHDSAYLFDEFIKTIKNHKKIKQNEFYS
ncbi:MAG: carbamoyl-phosphate synthase small subunit [Bacteroidetes bacterium]|nr:MAG: carbamoyl-phosphate synthase small subunit [Bacteroidota bacterium]